MIHIKDLSLSFGFQTVFDNITININQDSKLGLVGLNGSGKSTLLKVLAKLQTVDSGTISVLPGKKIAYMPQEVVLESNKTILQETLQAVKELTTLQQELAAMEILIEQGKGDEHVLEAYVEAQEKLAGFEPKQLEAQAQQILHGLGFKLEQLHQSVSTLSVGWKMRIVLAQLLLQKADFYLLDEPTNHLDIITKDWFISFLQNSNFGFLLVCHERYFLDKVCTSIISLEQGHAKTYKGNYSAFETQHEHNMQQLQNAYTQQQKDIKQKAETIARYKAKASKAKMAKSMQKKLDATELITLPPSGKTVHFNFPEPKRSGRTVLTVGDVTQTFGNKTIFDHININIERTQRVALVAANGVGKTTLFHLIVGKLPLIKGIIEFGSQVNYTIFAQDQNEALDLDQTVLQNVISRCSSKSEQQIRSLLGAFLFDNDDVKKKVRVLSGGEKNRLAMSIVLMQDSNFLLLDEPTNHLDIPSKEILVTALKEFKGTLLFVSHDHTFINELATHVIELTPHAAHIYEGNYEAFLYHKQQMDMAQNKKNVPEQKNCLTAVDERAELLKQSRLLEQKIEKCEKELKRINDSFEDFEYGTPGFKQTEKKLLQKQFELETLVAQWQGLIKL